MTAAPNLPYSFAARKFRFNKSGVLVLAGFGIKVKVQSGHLEIEGWLRPKSAQAQASPHRPRT